MIKTLTRSILLVLLATATVHGGIFYLTDGDILTAYRIDLPSGDYLGSFSTFPFAFPIAVSDTVRIGQRNNGQGAEYSLLGTATGVTFTGAGGITQLLDGTTDGSTYNYGVTCCGTNVGVYRGDRLWQGLELLFGLPSDGSGITYDPVNESLWISFANNTIAQYSFTGTLISSFGAQNDVAALAYDASSDSFWYHINGTSRFVNVNRSGQELHDLTIAGLFTFNAYGGEMAILGALPEGQVPEPGSWVLAVSGLALVVARFRRRSS
jgi:hypothetical protein